MNGGVQITSGAKDWQIFQQDPQGKAQVSLKGKYTLTEISPEPPFTYKKVAGQNEEISLRVVCEASGRQIVPWTPCNARHGYWSATIELPVGGLYRLETRLFYDGWYGYSSTRGDMIHHLGVGDVFVVAGQSNASGRAKTPIEDGPSLGVHLLRNAGHWDLATHPLNETSGTPLKGHSEAHNPGHSAYLAFAKILQKALGYPIGLVVTAHGGTPFRWWNPRENGALYYNMLNILEKNKIKPKALLWYQGEAEGYEDGTKDYLERFSYMVNSLRTALKQPELPVLTVQLGPFLGEADEALDRHWGSLRQQQMQAMTEIPKVYTVPVNDVPLIDTAHLDSAGNLMLAERLASCALATLYSREIPWQALQIQSAVQTASDNTILRFDYLYHSLEVYALPAPQLPFTAEDAQGLVSVKDYRVEDDLLFITWQRELAFPAVVHGAWKANPGQAIPHDSDRMPMASFYNVPIQSKEEAN